MLTSLGVYRTCRSMRQSYLHMQPADHSSRPTYVCLPSGLYHARSGRILQQSGPNQEVTPIPGIYFFDGWRVRPCMDIPTDLPRTQDPPEHDTQLPAATSSTAEPPQTPDKEARDILATAIRNQADQHTEAAIRAYKYSICMPWSVNTAHSSRRYMRSPKNTPHAAKAPESLKYEAQPQELPAVPPQLRSSELATLLVHLA